MKWFGLILCLLIMRPAIAQEDSLMNVIADVVTIRSTSIAVPLARSDIEIDSNTTHVTFAPLLNASPGIWMQNGALNTNRISIRGIGNREPFATSKLKAYLDEIPLTSGIGESSVEDIGPGLLDAIQVWRNPASAIWGAGLGGMLHLRSRKPQADRLEIGLTAGSFGRLEADATGTVLWGDKGQHSTLLRFGYVHDDGYRENNDYDRSGLTLYHRWQASPRLQVSLFLHHIWLEAFIPSSLGITAFNEDPGSAAGNWASVSGNEDYTRWVSAVGWQWSDNHKWTLKGSLFTTQFNLDEIRPFNVLSESDDTWGIRARLIHEPSSALSITLGTELQFENYLAMTFTTEEPGVPGEFLGTEEEKRDYTNYFADVQWNLSNKVLLYGGVNVNSTDLEGADDLNYGTDVSPTLGISYTIRPQALAVFGSVSRGFSPVSISAARNADGTLNRELKPESGWNVEAGVRHSNNKSALELVAYRMLVDNLVVQERMGPDLYVASNAGKTLHQGIELSGQTSIGKLASFRAAYTLADHRFKEFLDEDNDFSGNDLTGTAPHTLDATLSTSGLFAQFSLRYRFVSKSPITDDNAVYGNVSHVVDLLVSYPFTVGKWQSAATLRVENAFDTQYASMYQINARGFGGSEPRYYYPGKPRAVYVGLRFGLNSPE